MELLGDRGAAHDRTSLEDRHLEAGGREIRGADQAVVSAADDQRIARLAPRPAAFSHEPYFS
jgi:hypothetical protein